MTFNMRKLVKTFAKSEAGASMVEYGIALLVTAAIGVGAMTTLGGYVDTNINAACDAYTSTTGGC